MANLHDYLLVKDKDGKMKYFKDGQFFTLEQIQGTKPAAAPAMISGKKELRPVLRFADSKKSPAKSLFTFSDEPTVKPPQKKAVIKTFAPAARPAASKSEGMVRLDKMIRGEAVLGDLVKKSKAASLPASAPAPHHSLPVAPKAEPFKIEDLPATQDLSAKRLSDQKMIDDRVNALIGKMKIKFSDEKIKTRFINILTTYFRGIRNREEVEYVLTLPKLSGGLELPEDKAKIIGALLAHSAEEAGRERRTLKEPAVVSAKTVSFEPSRPRAIITPPVNTASAMKTQPAPVNLPQSVASRTLVPAPQQASGPVRRPVSNVAGELRPVMREALAAPRALVGPLDELRSLDLAAFRSLGDEPERIKAKIINKINILADQSLVKKLSGVQAWRRSPAYALYLSMAMQGLRAGLPMAKVIERRQFDNEETLSLSEYEMIAELNRQLSI